MSKPRPFLLFHLITSATVFLLMFVFLAEKASANVQEDIAELKKQIQQLKQEQALQKQLFIDEIAALKMSEQIPELKEGAKTISNLGMAASKVYSSKSKVSIGGYGELTYFDPRTQGSNNESDAYRLVPYIGYRFNDWILFNSEIEFEHGGANRSTGVAVIEFMYLDFLLSESANIRIGNYLIPVGITNLKHEPVYFGSVNRPLIEKNLIPSTWHENGILVYGNVIGDFQYQAGIFTSPYAKNPTNTDSNFSPSSWIRGGRQKGAQAKAEDWSGVVRLDYSGIRATDVGFSYVYGDTSQDVAGLGNLTYSLAEVHFETRLAGFEWNGLYTRGTFDGAGELTYTSGGTLGELVEGWYTTFSYDLMRFQEGASYQLPVFVRYSEYDLNKEVATGATRDKALSKKVTTIGLNYKPTNQVVLKADFQAVDTDAGYGGDQFSLGMGFVF